MALPSSYPYLSSLTYLAAPYASASPTRPTGRPLSKISILILIRFLISLALRIPNAFVRTMRVKTRGISYFQLLLRTTCHYTSSISVNRHPTDL